MLVSATVLAQPHLQVWFALSRFLASRLTDLDELPLERSPTPPRYFLRRQDTAPAVPVWLL